MEEKKCTMEVDLGAAPVDVFVVKTNTGVVKVSNGKANNARGQSVSQNTSNLKNHSFL